VDAGSTCIACGITEATSLMSGQTKPKVAIIVTDGQDSDLDELYNSLVQANNQRVYRVAVGVGSGINRAVLDYIASNLPNSTQKASFSVSSFSSLSTVVNTVSAAACTDFASIDFTTPIPRTIPGFNDALDGITAFGRLLGIIFGIGFAICVICIIAIIVCVCGCGICAAKASTGGKTITTTTTTTHTEVPMTTIQPTVIQTQPVQQEFVPMGQPIQPQVTHVEHHTTHYQPSPYNTGGPPPQVYNTEGQPQPY